MKLSYQTKNGRIDYEAEVPTVPRFRAFWNEFKRLNLFDKYNIYVHGGFVSHLMEDPQWDTQDVDLFIGRQQNVDMFELKHLLRTLLFLGRKHKLRLDIKYSTTHENPNMQKWGEKVQLIALSEKLHTDTGDGFDFTSVSVELENGLYEVNRTYEIQPKDLERLNNGKTLYKAINLRKHKF